MRRLPPWMLGGASTGEAAARNSSEAEAPKTKAEKRPKRVQKPKEKDLNLSSEKPKRVRRKIGEETKRSSIGPEMIQSVTCPEDDDLTVDDLLSFAHEYVQRDEEETRKERERSLSMSETTLVLDESNTTTSSQGGTKDPTADEMLELLMGPFFKKR
ncbi:unnamed protein product [Arabidopsis halleri]